MSFGRSNQLIRAATGAFAVLVLAACHSSTGSDQPGPPASVSVVGASTRSASPGATVSPPLAVVVRDAKGKPVPGVTVSWSGGGTFAPAQSVTGADGVAQTQWTLPASAAPQQAVAAVGALQAVFTAQPVLAGGLTVTATQGSGAVITSGSARTVEIRATAASGAPVPGVPVTWAISRTGGTGELPLLNDPHGVTDADGRATVSVYAQPNNYGTFVVRATVGGNVLDIPVSAQGGPVVSVSLVYGTVGPIVVQSQQPVEVYAKDAAGNYRYDLPVEVVSIEGGGTVSDFVPYSNFSPGRRGIWTLGTVTAGIYTYPSQTPVTQRLRVRVGGVEAVAALTPLPGPTAGGAVAPDPVVLAAPGDMLTVIARPVDQFGNWTNYPNGVPQAPRTFTIEDPSIATVSPSGTVTAVANGSTRLFVTIPYNTGTTSTTYADTAAVLVGPQPAARAPSRSR